MSWRSGDRISQSHLSIIIIDEHVGRGGCSLRVPRSRQTGGCARYPRKHEATRYQRPVDTATGGLTEREGEIKRSWREEKSEKRERGEGTRRRRARKMEKRRVRRSDLYDNSSDVRFATFRNWEISRSVEISSLLPHNRRAAASACLVSERTVPLRTRASFVELLKVRRAAIDGTRASARCWRVIPRESRAFGWGKPAGNRKITIGRGGECRGGARGNAGERNDEPVIVFFLRDADSIKRNDDVYPSTCFTLFHERNGINGKRTDDGPASPVPLLCIFRDDYANRRAASDFT